MPGALNYNACRTHCRGLMRLWLSRPSFQAQAGPERRRILEAKLRNYNESMSANPAIAVSVPPPPSQEGPGAGHPLQGVLDLIGDDFAALNRLIPRQLASDVALVEEIGHYIVESGGKRLRPLLVLLAARCCGFEGRRQVALAAIIEFLHTATLLHDDVVDRSDLRRGRATANALWGNAPSVLVGDFLYSRAFQLMVELNDMRIMSILSDATNAIAEGEVMQFANIGNLEMDEARYMEVIRCKTALLFQATTQSAAVLAGGNATQTEALKQFGLEFGLAYQLVDDWLDYAGDAATMGKNAGGDLAERKPTLPLIFALAKSEPGQAAFIRSSLSAETPVQLDRVAKLVHASGAMEHTQAAARLHSQRAIRCLEALPDNAYREALRTVAEFAVARLS